MKSQAIGSWASMGALALGAGLILGGAVVLWQGHAVALNVPSTKLALGLASGGTCCALIGTVGLVIFCCCRRNSTKYYIGTAVSDLPEGFSSED